VTFVNSHAPSPGTHHVGMAALSHLAHHELMGNHHHHVTGSSNHASHFSHANLHVHSYHVTIFNDQGPPVDRRQNFQGQHFQSPGARYDRTPPPAGPRMAAPRPTYGGNMQSQPQFFRPPPRNPSIPRRPPGCWVCGRFGCHSDIHSPTSEPPALRTNPPPQPSPQSTNPFQEGHYPPPVPSRPGSENGPSTPQLGDRSPITRQ